MTDEKEGQKNDFNWKQLITAEPLHLKGVSIFLSVQQNTDNSELKQLCIKKQGVNNDGSPRGVPKQLWLPLEHAVYILTQAQEFLKKNK